MISYIRISQVVSVCFLCAVRGFENPAENSESSRHFINGFFIDEIFKKYGDNNIITYEGFEHLLDNLGLGKLKFEQYHDVSMHKINGTFREFHDELSLHRHNHEQTTESDIVKETLEKRKKRNFIPNEKDAVKLYKQRCLTPQDMLITFGLEPHHDLVISPDKYLQICPAIIYELDQKLCHKEETFEAVEEPKEYHLVWIYASVSILVMGVSGMLCVLLVPVVGTDSQSPLLQFLISLATGTLCGDALIHLLPQVFSKFDGETESELSPIFKGSSALLAIFFFYIIESTLRRWKAKKSKILKEVKDLDIMLPISEKEQVLHFGHSHDDDGIKSVAWMAILGDVLHNVTDGLSIGAAFTTRLSAGFASSIAIFCHELPHELGDYAILLSSGMSVKKSLFYNVLSSIFSLLGMVTGILLGEFQNASLWINSITAGSFLYVALTDLLPEMKRMASGTNFWNFFVQLIGFCCGGALMYGIALYEDEIEAILC